jgi:hypothetical protein
LRSIDTWNSCPEPGTTFGLVAEAQFAPMLDGYGTADGQPKAGTVGFCCEKWPEHFPGCFLWYAGTAVEDGKFHACRIA